MERKLFTEKHMYISAFLAGPIPPGFLMYKNYRRLGKRRQAYITLITTLIFTVAFLYGIFQVPEDIIDKVPSFVFTALYGMIVYVFFRNFMAKDVNEAFEAGAEKESGWTVVGIAVLGLVLTLGTVLGFAIQQPFYKGEVVNIDGNELYYNSNLIPIEDANKVVKQFKMNDFFGADYGNIARIQLIKEGYIITMVVDEQLWGDSEIVSTINSIKLVLKIELEKPIRLRLESVSLSGKSKYKEI